MWEFIWETYGTIIVAPPHYKQKRFFPTQWQFRLLALRPKIESVFDCLKRAFVACDIICPFSERIPFYYLWNSAWASVYHGYGVFRFTNRCS
jgi:hypothetical protein